MPCDPQKPVLGFRTKQGLTDRSRLLGGSSTGGDRVSAARRRPPLDCEVLLRPLQDRVAVSELGAAQGKAAQGAAGPKQAERDQLCPPWQSNSQRGMRPPSKDLLSISSEEPVLTQGKGKSTGCNPSEGSFPTLTMGLRICHKQAVLACSRRGWISTF